MSPTISAPASLSAFVGIVLLTSPSAAEVIVVDNPPSLRSAIANAAPGDVITFTRIALDNNSALLSGDPIIIDKELTIDASSIPVGIRLIGGNDQDLSKRSYESQVLVISDGDPASSISVVLKNLHIEGGLAGSGELGANIYNQENLTLVDCTVRDGLALGDEARGGGIYSTGGTLTLVGCDIIHNRTHGTSSRGGGIFLSQDNPCNITNSNISHNRVEGENSVGGGIFSEADATLINCTLHRNSATGRGGGYHNSSGLARLIHCTVTENSAPAGQGGGILGMEDSETELSACVVRDNSSDDLSFDPNITNPFRSIGANLVGTGNALATFTETGDGTGTATPINLAPLGDFGGPSMTRPPLPGSPALDRATASSQAADQRGVPRPLDGDGDTLPVADSGAAEVGTPILVDTNADEDNGANIGEGTSLREAIALADLQHQTINFAPALDGQTISLDASLGPLAIDKSLIIDAAALAEGMFVDGNDNGDDVDDPDETRCFEIDDLLEWYSDYTHHAVFLRNLTVQNGGSGNINNREALSMEDCRVLGGRGRTSVASSFDWGQLAFENCMISHFRGDRAIAGLSITLDRCTVSHNRGEGIYLINSHDDTGPNFHRADLGIVLKRTTISHNLSRGIRCWYAPLTMTDCTVSDNQAEGDGGGIWWRRDRWVFGHEATLTNCTIHGNSATGVGGAYLNRIGHTRLLHCTITGNSSGVTSYGDEQGVNNTVTMRGCVVYDNGLDLHGIEVDPEYRFADFKSLGSNFVGSNFGVSDFAFTKPGDQQWRRDPILLAPLGDYGGPTPARPPLPNSPAIDAVVPQTEVCPVDQLGNPRPFGPRPDIGAVETLPFVALGLPSKDGDTIPDALESPEGPYAHLSPTRDDSALDTDHDGSTDAEEIGNLTNLFDPEEYLRLVSIKKAPGFDPESNPSFRVTVGTLFPGLQFSLETNSTLDDSFETAVGPFTAVDQEMIFRVFLSPNRGFVRVRRH